MAGAPSFETVALSDSRKRTVKHSETGWQSRTPKTRRLPMETPKATAKDSAPASLLLSRLVLPSVKVSRSRTKKAPVPAFLLAPTLASLFLLVWCLEMQFAQARCLALRTASSVLLSVQGSLPLSVKQTETASAGQLAGLFLSAAKKLPAAGMASTSPRQSALPVLPLDGHHSELLQKRPDPRRCPVTRCFPAALQHPQAPAAGRRFPLHPGPASLLQS